MSFPCLCSASIMNVSTPIAPFAVASPPPPPVILLLCSTELIAWPLQALLVHQDLHISARQNRFHPYFQKKSHNTNNILAENKESSSTDDLPPPSPLTTPEHSPRSSPSPEDENSRIRERPRARKVRFSRPKGAGRLNLQSLVQWESSILEAVRVRFYYIACSGLY